MSKAEFNAENILLVAVDGVTEAELVALRALVIRDKDYWVSQLLNTDEATRSFAQVRVDRENNKLAQIDKYLLEH